MSHAERCPVCGGTGKVPAGFYDCGTHIHSTVGITPETCRTCKGTGMVVVDDRGEIKR